MVWKRKCMNNLKVAANNSIKKEPLLYPRTREKVALRIRPCPLRVSIC